MLRAKKGNSKLTTATGEKTQKNSQCTKSSSGRNNSTETRNISTILRDQNIPRLISYYQRIKTNSKTPKSSIPWDKKKAQIRSQPRFID